MSFQNPRRCSGIGVHFKVALFFLGVLAILIHPSLVQAQSDSGTISVSGSVAPAPTTITTSISASGTDPIAQNQEITYTITYTSTNVTSVPIHFKAVWDKGTVDGATEANVDVVEYVLGSATDGYGSVSPVIDTINREISWDIPLLAAGVGAQQVEFKLRTTANYTGTRLVSFPTYVYVISPLGVADKVVTKNYQFVPQLVSPSPTPAPAVSPTPSPSTASSPAPTVTPSPVPGSILEGNLFESISYPAIGATSARIRVNVRYPTDLVMSFGSDASKLFNNISLTAGESTQDFVLVNLQPKTRYFFQVKSKDGGLRSDVFTFETASKVVEQEASAMVVTMTQERNVVYFGPPKSASTEQTAPIVMTEGSIIDLIVKVPNSGSIKQIEAFIRSSAVLGASTEEFNLDELQSSTTKLAQIGEDLYVGKLRVPETTGLYEVASRIEDVYGNITEHKIQDIVVVQPFRVLDAASNTPLQHAKVKLSIYNPDTKLYEVVSNVTFNVRNPSYSKENGVVDFVLLPSRYKAMVSLVGYYDQHIEFEVGSSSTDYPQVMLVKSSWLSSFQGIGGFITQTSEELISGLLGLDHIDVYYQITVVITLALLAYLLLRVFVISKYPGLTLDSWMSRAQAQRTSNVLMNTVFLSIQALRLIVEVLVVHTFVMGTTFLYSSDPRNGVFLLGVGAIEVTTLCYTAILLKYRELNDKKCQ